MNFDWVTELRNCSGHKTAVFNTRCNHTYSSMLQSQDGHLSQPPSESLLMYVMHPSPFQIQFAPCCYFSPQLLSQQGRSKHEIACSDLVTRRLCCPSPTDMARIASPRHNKTGTKILFLAIQDNHNFPAYRLSHVEI